MEMEIVILGVSHYDMTGDGGGKGASIKVYGNLTNGGNYVGVSISDADIPYEEMHGIIENKFPARFKANVSMGSVKKRGSNKEVTAMTFSNLRFLHSVDLLQVKTA